MRFLLRDPRAARPDACTIDQFHQRACVPARRPDPVNGSGTSPIQLSRRPRFGKVESTGPTRTGHGTPSTGPTRHHRGDRQNCRRSPHTRYVVAAWILSSVQRVSPAASVGRASTGVPPCAAGRHGSPSSSGQARRRSHRRESRRTRRKNRPVQRAALRAARTGRIATASEGRAVEGGRTGLGGEEIGWLSGTTSLWEGEGWPGPQTPPRTRQLNNVTKMTAPMRMEPTKEPSVTDVRCRWINAMRDTGAPVSFPALPRCDFRTGCNLLPTDDWSTSRRATRSAGRP